MASNTTTDFEQIVRRHAARFDYPPTPDIAGSLQSRMPGRPVTRKRITRRFAFQAALGVLVLLLASLLVPAVRAAVLEFLQIGAARIYLATPTSPPASPTPGPSPTPYPSLFSTLSLQGETSLQEAQRQLDFSILLPAYPPELGDPDRVYLQDRSGDVLILVWLDPQDETRAFASLILMGPGAFLTKGAPQSMLELSVNGQHALWMTGTHSLFLDIGITDAAPTTVYGDVLIWEQDGITYRMEGYFDAQEAKRIAESLRPLP